MEKLEKGVKMLPPFSLPNNKMGKPFPGAMRIYKINETRDWPPNTLNRV